MRTSTSSALATWPRAAEVRVGASRLEVQLRDGREIAVPFDWFEFLAVAGEPQRAEFTVDPDGEAIYWPQLDESISVASLLGLADHAPPDPLTRTYIVDYRHDADGSWVGDVRGTDFSTFGRTLASAKRRSRELLRAYLEVSDLDDAGIHVVDQVRKSGDVASG